MTYPKPRTYREGDTIDIPWTEGHGSTTKALVLRVYPVNPMRDWPTLLVRLPDYPDLGTFEVDSFIVAASLLP